MGCPIIVLPPGQAGLIQEGGQGPRLARRSVRDCHVSGRRANHVAFSEHTPRMAVVLVDARPFPPGVLVFDLDPGLLDGGSPGPGPILGVPIS